MTDAGIPMQSLDDLDDEPDRWTLDDWRADVTAGRTEKGYHDWLCEQQGGDAK